NTSDARNTRVRCSTDGGDREWSGWRIQVVCCCPASPLTLGGVTNLGHSSHAASVLFGPCSVLGSHRHIPCSAPVFSPKQLCEQHWLSLLHLLPGGLHNSSAAAVAGMAPPRMTPTVPATNLRRAPRLDSPRASAFARSSNCLPMFA